MTNSVACRVGNGLHSISGWFELGSGWLVKDCSSHSIYKAKEVGPQSTKGVGSQDASMGGVTPMSS